MRRNHVCLCERSEAATGSSTRSSIEESVDVNFFSGQKVETYIGFLSEDEKDVATSIYTGSLLLT